MRVVLRICVAMMLAAWTAQVCADGPADFSIEGADTPYLDVRGVTKAKLKRGATIAHAFVAEDAQLVVSSGAEISHLTASGRARITIENGAELSHVTLNGSASARILGAQASFLTLDGESRAEIHRLIIHGGVFSAPGVSVNGGALIYAAGVEAHVHASNASFSNGKLKGTWEDGRPFSFWLVETVGSDDARSYRLPQSLPKQIVIHDLIGPSFDCVKAHTRAEKAVCSDSALKRMDNRLAVLYERVLNEADDAAAMRKAQRRWLASRDACRDNKCITTAYQTQISGFERVTGDLDRELVTGLCERLTDRAARRRHLQERQGAEDINNDGKPEKIRSCSEGVTAPPCIEYLDSAGRQLKIEPADPDSNDNDGFGVTPFRFMGKTFLLHSFVDGLGTPANLTYVSPNGKAHVLCEFENHIVSPLESGAPGYGDLCAAVSKAGTEVEEIAFDEASEIPYPAMERSQTDAEGLAWVEVGNDGRKERVLALQFAGSAGSGCDYRYFELMNAEGTQPLHDKSRRIFLRMQGVEEDDGYSERSCGVIHNRLLRYKGHIYYDHNVRNSTTDRRSVWQFERDQFKQVCSYGRAAETTVKGKR